MPLPCRLAHTLACLSTTCHPNINSKMQSDWSQDVTGSSTCAGKSASKRCVINDSSFMPCALGVNKQSSPCRKCITKIPKNIGLGLSDSPLLQSSRASRHLQRPSQTPEKRGLQSDSQQGRRPTKGLGSVLLPLQTALEICWHFLQHSSHLSHLLTIAHCETLLDFNYPENSFQLLCNITKSP